MKKKMIVMKKTNSLRAFWMMCVILIGSLIVTACDTGDELDTNQYSGGIELNVFGPSPVARGGELRFLGSGMNQVTGVIIPGSAEITDIKVFSDTEIRVTVPQTAEVGYVVLHTAKGDITTKTTLTYSEPISLKSISPVSIKPGGVLTITGEYLNLMHEVIFTDGVIVSEKAFIKHQRDEIQVVVPAEAQSGKVVISDAAELPNWIYSDEELSVVLPSVDVVADLTDKKPGDLIEIAGENFDLVEDIQLPDETSVPFTVEDNRLSFTLPEGTTDGTIVMIPASGVKVAIANIGIAIPGDLQVTPATGLRENDEISIKGTNMELITSVLFTGVEEAIEPISKTATEIKIAMPGKATSGQVTLNTASGKTAFVTIETAKPAFVSYNPNPVSAGTELTISGQNLDLIQSLTFTGDVSVDITASSASALTSSVPTTAESGIVIVTMKNGEMVEFPELTIDKPVCAYIPVMPEEEIRGGKLFIVAIANEDKLTGVRLNGETLNFVLEDDKLYIGIPSDAFGERTLNLVSSNGEIEYVITIVPSGSVESVIWEGLVDLTWGDGGRVIIPVDKLNGVTAGTYLKIYFQQKEVWGQAQINNGKWNEIRFAELANKGSINTNTYNDISVTSQELRLTQVILDNIVNNASDGNAIFIQGANWIITKLTLVTKAKVSEVIYTGPTDAGNWSGSAQIAADKFVNVAVGNVVQVKTSNVSSDAQGSFKDGSWSQIADGTEYFDISGDFELEVTADIRTKLQSSGLIVSGKNYTIETVSIVKEM